MNIAVLGSGGREHALCWALAKSPSCDALYAVPGNGGTTTIAENVEGIDICDAQAVCDFARVHAIDLVVVGPEAPLVAGVADALRSEGIATFGPDSQGAQLEGSKTYSKQFMVDHDLPTARYRSFSDRDAAWEFAQGMEAPLVVKADGLAAGKGVLMCDDMDDVRNAIDNCFDGAFGDAGSAVVIEECLQGPECSLLAFVSDGVAHCMAAAQDHKRAYDGDTGPNTGGMGVYSPVPIVTAEEQSAMVDIMQRAAAATKTAPFTHDYRGVLYGGFMLTAQGPKLLEFNARFGDPETQVILPRLQSDVVEVIYSIAQGTPETINLEWSDQWAVCVVLASAGYPGSYEKGKVILGVDEAEALDGVVVFHAGTAFNADEELITAGGRVLNVVALGDSFEEARERAYQAADLINFEGKQFRTDIGARAARGRGAWDN